MKKYDIFLFDADNTLYDFDQSRDYALKVILNQFGKDFTPEASHIFEAIGKPLWEKYESNKILEGELQEERMTSFLKAFDIQGDPIEAGAQFLFELGKSSYLIEGALKLCEKIAEAGKKTFIITNGLRGSNDAREAYSPIIPHVVDAFVSESIGHRKPSQAYFDHVLANIPAVAKDKILIIGDSLTADIAGGQVMGVDTCWFNPKKLQNTTQFIPTYEVASLEEVERFV